MVYHAEDFVWNEAACFCGRGTGNLRRHHRNRRSEAVVDGDTIVESRDLHETGKTTYCRPPFIRAWFTWL